MLSSGCVASPEKEELQINPTIRYQGNLLIIRNNDTFTYDYIKIKLNDGTFQKDLPLSIPPGEEVRCELSDFVKSDGERFNIFKYKPTNISISCVVSKDLGGGKWERLGNTFYYAKFN